MAILSNESINALADLHDLEVKEIMKVVKKLKKLGLEHHTDHAICALAECGAQLTKI